MNKTVYHQHLGKLDFLDSWKYQEWLLKKITDTKVLNREQEHKQETPNFILTVEHPHVYTLGKSGKKQHLLVSETFLQSINATFYEINRGGDITYHGPGQLVVYPILDLENFFTDIHKYIRYLEEVIIQMLSEYNIKGERSSGETGVWLDTDKIQMSRKICAIGVKSSRWATMHGLALNVNTDLKYFDYIVPCGIQNKKVASMHLELNRHIDEESIRIKTLYSFEKVFNCTLSAMPIQYSYKKFCEEFMPPIL